MAAAQPEKIWTAAQAAVLKKELMAWYGVLAVSWVWFFVLPTLLAPHYHLLVLAVLSMMIGCKHHLLLSRSVKEKDGTTSTVKSADQETLSEGDAYMFPVMGSCVLFGLFLVFKYLAKEWVKTLLMLYVTVMCVAGLGNNFKQLIECAFSKFTTYEVILPYFGKLTYLDVMCVTLAAGIGASYAVTRHWALNNLMGVSFCVAGMKVVNLNAYKVGCIMFVGLFIYDVFWVFGSKSIFGDNVMVTVAKGLNAPIKLMFPRAGVANATNPDAPIKMQFSMLGLGDIVVPGLFLNVLIQWDAHINPNGARVYFNTSLVAYTLSLITTVAVMLIWDAAQPALLYIVPFILVASFGVAVARGEVKALWKYECVPEEEAEEAEGGGDGKKTKKSGKAD